MMRTFSTIAVLLALTPARAAEPDAKGVEFFEKKIRPVLVAHCYSCHSAQAEKLKGGLALDTKAGWVEGGDSGPAIVPGEPKKSLLLKAINHQDLKMPSAEKKLPASVLADFEAWVKMGAPDPRDGPSRAKKGVDLVEGRKHWSYRPVVEPPSPDVRDASWPRGSIDRLVLAQIEANRLAPASDAKPYQLIRRIHYALIGLPPTPEEVVAFETAYATDPDRAIADLADRLLASRRFGETWARHWMDGVRFDQLANTIDLYRDWLVRAFNRDLPYDEFVRMQLAGDLLPRKDDPREDDDRLIATAMLSLNLNEMDFVEGCIEVVGQQLLGVSINCAKCHDHKFDAFTQSDYYGLAGVFTSSQYAGTKGSKNPSAKGLPLRSFEGLHVVAWEEGKVADTNLLIRGERSQRGPVIPRRFPLVLAGDDPPPIASMTKQSGRLELANWIVDAKNPLTARVMANRIWKWTTGRALVNTPSDFGVTGDRPIHPELLDRLASDFVRQGWSVKRLIRQIVTSRTFRQSSGTRNAERGMRTEDPSVAILTGAALIPHSAFRIPHSEDSENRLLTRMPVRRLDAEQLVDSLYFVADRLDAAPPPFGLKLANRGAPKNAKNLDAPSHRAVYGLGLVPAAMFDAADPDLLTVSRDESVTAPQMLFFLNNPTVHRIAAAVAKRSEAVGGDSTAKVIRAYRILFGRQPSERELKQMVAFVKTHGTERLCHLLLCSSEFSYVE